jgi:endonuclease/exonuclease/phosphatase family metal-dependent hydrolase
MHLDRVVERLKDWAPDIVGLQEVDRFWRRSGFRDQPGIIAGELGYDYAFGANVQWGIGQYGNVLLSRWPILEHENYPLAGNHEPRGLLWTTVETPQGKLNVLVTHLGLTRKGRLRQLSRIEEVIDALDGPVLLLGDFNADNEAAFARLTEVIRAAGLKTFPSSDPIYATDTIFVSSELAAKEPEAIDDLTSDHRPVVANITRRR